MAKRLAVIAVMVVATLFIPVLAKADSVWTYQGNAVSVPSFSPCVGTCLQSISGEAALTGTVLLNDSNQVEAWSFSVPGVDGELNPSVLSNLNVTNASFNLFNCTSCSGTPFKGWSISMFVPPPPFSGLAGIDMSSSWNPDTGVGLDYVNNHNGGLGQVYVTNNPGVWTEVVSTPEPGSLLLLGAGITALALAISLQKNLA